MKLSGKLLGVLVILFSIPLTLLLISVVQEIRKRAQAPAGTATVSFLPSEINVSPQSVFTVTASVLNVLKTDGQTAGQIAAVALSLSFDKNVLEMTGLSRGNILTGAGCNLFPITPTGWAQDPDFSAINSQGGFNSYGGALLGTECSYLSAGTLANIEFRAKAAGTSQLTVTSVDLSDPDARGYNTTINDGTVTVASANSTPEITSTPPTTAVVGQQYTYNIRGSDPDGDPLTFALRDFTPGMQLSSTGADTAQMTWTPTAADGGSGGMIHSAAITVDDQHGHVIAQQFRIAVSAAPPPQASTIFVDDNGNDRDGCGRTQSDSCASIQKGIDEVAEGGVVYVADGTYQSGFLASDPVRSTVTITKNRLKLIGNVENPSTVQVKRGTANFAGQPPINQWFVFTIDGAQDVRIRGFSIQGFDGVAITGSSSAELKRNFIISQNVGIYNHQTVHSQIINNTIYGSNFGVEAWGTSRVEIYQNDIHLGSNGQMCIAKHDQAHVVASGNNTGCNVTDYTAGLIPAAAAAELNTNYEPMFVDPASGNLCLNPLSPLIDLGVSDVDGDGVDDITDYSGEAPDVGACEYQFCQALSGQDLLWDLNGDGTVTLMDLILMVHGWRDQGNYNPRLDFDSDGDVDLFDIVRVANHWAESCTP